MSLISLRKRISQVKMEKKSQVLVQGDTRSPFSSPLTKMNYSKLNKINYSRKLPRRPWKTGNKIFHYVSISYRRKRFFFCCFLFFFFPKRNEKKLVKTSKCFQMTQSFFFFLSAPYLIVKVVIEVKWRRQLELTNYRNFQKEEILSEQKRNEN